MITLQSFSKAQENADELDQEVAYEQTKNISKEIKNHKRERWSIQ